MVLKSRLSSFLGRSDMLQKTDPMNAVNHRQNRINAADCDYQLQPIGKLRSNSRIKPQMYVRRRTMYEKAPFYSPELR